MDFDTAFDRLMGHEDGYVNNPADPGGETNWGITWPVLREAIAAGIVPPNTTIKDLTRDQAKVIYKWRFWEHGQMDQFDPAVAFQTFDFAVNSGIETAIRKLQAAAGVADDGHIGPVTVAAIKNRGVNDMIMLLTAERIEYQAKLKNGDTFWRGWMRRNAGNLRYAATDN